jgi:hypothetical protein
VVVLFSCFADAAIDSILTLLTSYRYSTYILLYILAYHKTKQNKTKHSTVIDSNKMKVFLHYEDHENSDYHKSLKITLPKSWKTGPASNLLAQFVESYNAKFQDTNPLTETQLHLSQRQQQTQSSSGSDNKTTELVPICSDTVVIEEVADRADVYICHGPSTTLAEIQEAKIAAEQARQDSLKSTVACTHFGCSKRFPRGGPYPACCYHKLPPVFHETAKYWACCPNKKAYDWEDFQRLPGCETGICTEIKEEGQKSFLGGSDLREQAAAPTLKSIDDFNKVQSAGGAEAAPVLERLQRTMQEVGVEQELFDQVVEGMRKELSVSVSVSAATSNTTEAEVLAAISKELGDRLKAMMKGIAAEQLRIK